MSAAVQKIEARFIMLPTVGCRAGAGGGWLAGWLAANYTGAEVAMAPPYNYNGPIRLATSIRILILRVRAKHGNFSYVVEKLKARVNKKLRRERSKLVRLSKPWSIATSIKLHQLKATTKR